MFSQKFRYNALSFSTVKPISRFTTIGRKFYELIAEASKRLENTKTINMVKIDFNAFTVTSTSILAYPP